MYVVSSQWLESSPSPSRHYPESESSRKSFKLAARVGLESDSSRTRVGLESDSSRTRVGLVELLRLESTNLLRVEKCQVFVGECSMPIIMKVAQLL